MPRFPLDDPPLPAPEAPRYDLMTVQELIGWLRALDERVRKLELAINLDPAQPAQAMGILTDDQDPNP